MRGPCEVCHNRLMSSVLHHPISCYSPGTTSDSATTMPSIVAPTIACVYGDLPPCLAEPSRPWDMSRCSVGGARGAETQTRSGWIAFHAAARGARSTGCYRFVQGPRRGLGGWSSTRGLAERTRRGAIALCVRGTVLAEQEPRRGLGKCRSVRGLVERARRGAIRWALPRCGDEAR